MNDTHHWSDSLPCFVPVWHNLNHRVYRHTASKDERDLDPNLEIDIGGIGYWHNNNNTAQRKVRRLIYKVNKPPLPFYLESSRVNSPLAGLNCLAYSSHQGILFSAHRNCVRTFRLSINEDRFKDDDDDNGLDSNYPHQFTNANVAPVNPFVFQLDKLSQWGDYSDAASKHVLELKLHETDRNLEVMTQSRLSYKIYRWFKQNNEFGDSDNLNLLKEIRANSGLFPKFNALLNYCDRNTELPEQVLSSFVNDSRIYRWNLEKNKLLIEHNLPRESDDTEHNMINLSWAHGLSPFLYLVSNHRKLWFGDVRCPQSVQCLLDARQCVFFHESELLQSFITNPLDPHQVIVATDFNIQFLDIRFPSKSMFQSRHMFTYTLVDKLHAKAVSIDNSNKLLLLASNSERASLYTFDSMSSMQPVMQHSPFYIKIPRETENVFPRLGSQNTFIKGLQILPSFKRRFSTGHLFSLASMINNGDIYLQDFSYRNTDESKSSCNATLLSDLSSDHQHGDLDYITNSLDQVTQNYLSALYQHIQKLDPPNKIPITAGQSIDKRVINFLDPQSGRKCPAHKLKKDKFCACLCNFDSIEEERRLLEQTGSDDEGYDKATHQESLQSANYTIRLSDQDPIDFKVFKENWLTLAGKPEKPGIRSLCNSVTAAVGDRWFNDPSMEI